MAAAAAAKLQSCPNLCDSIDSSLPGSSIPGCPPGKNIGVGCHFLLQCMKVKSESEVTQVCPTLSNPRDCSLPGSSVHGIYQARVLERVAIAFSGGHYWVFQICWHIECSTFTASSFRIWNNSTGIPSSPLALFVVMLPNAHLTSHSIMSGSRWVITPSWLSGSWRSFLYSSSVYSFYLFLVYSACF